ncbi:MAG: hypothetical protein IMW95_12570 [Moorella humiferrea]|nr:hypothetical protein [Moorella sulfitireducens]MBE3573758.1 hypothetical protein [Moorella humiferrea]
MDKKAPMPLAQHQQKDENGRARYFQDGRKDEIKVTTTKKQPVKAAF